VAEIVEQDTHDESYFASFTDMLVGVIFIFIILLLISANNYQEATEEVIQTNHALVEARNKTRDEERDRARDEAHDRVRDEAYNKEIARINAIAEAKTVEAARALEEVKALQAAKALAENNVLEATRTLAETKSLAETNAIEAARAVASAKAQNLPAAIQDLKTINDVKAAKVAKANDEVLMRRLTDTQQNIFNDTRAKLLGKIQEALHMQGFEVNANIREGTLLIPENILFDPSLNPGEVSYRGKQTVYTLTSLLSKYLPCVSPTADPSRLADCNSLGFPPNNGLDVIFIDDYPDSNISRENKLLLSVQRTVSLFNELKNDDPLMDKELRNIAGVPILDIKVNQERRKASDREQDNPAFRKFVVLRFVTRSPNPADITNLRNSETQH